MPQFGDMEDLLNAIADESERRMMDDFETQYGYTEPTEALRPSDVDNDFLAQIRSERAIGVDLPYDVSDTFRNQYDIDSPVDMPTDSELDAYRRERSGLYFTPETEINSQKPGIYSDIQRDNVLRSGRGLYSTYRKGVYDPLTQTFIEKDFAPTINKAANTARKINLPTPRSIKNDLKRLANDIVNTTYLDRTIQDPNVNLDLPIGVKPIQERINMLVDPAKRPFHAPPSGHQNTTLSFSNPDGTYSSAREISDHLTDLKRQVNSAAFDPDDIGWMRAQIKDYEIALDKMRDPFYQPLIKYAMGDIMSQTPEGGYVDQTPIGGHGGARDKMYSRYTKNVLATNARSQAKATRRAGNIWKNIHGEEIEFDPNTLKEHALSKSFEFPDKMSLETRQKIVKNLAADQDAFKPSIVYQGNPNKSPITVGSAAYNTRNAILGGASLGAADAIPSPEVIRKLYEEGLPSAALQARNEIGNSLVIGAGTTMVGQGLSAAPVIGPAVSVAMQLLPGVGLGMGIVGATQSANELSKQQTGEGLLSKFRQTIGTEPRSGIATRGAAKTPIQRQKRQIDLINNPPKVSPMEPYKAMLKTKRDYKPISDEFARRRRMASGRFNPARGEFGITEMLLGR